MKSDSVSIITTIPTKTDSLVTTYTQAIAEYIRTVHKTENLKFDTLFFWKRKFGQADDFPDIKLPAVIENTSIQLLDLETDAITTQQKNHPENYYINLIGWVDKSNAEFIFVTFTDGGKPQFNLNLKYELDTVEKAFVLKKNEMKKN